MPKVCVLLYPTPCHMADGASLKPVAHATLPHSRLRRLALLTPTSDQATALKMNNQRPKLDQAMPVRTTHDIATAQSP